MLFADKRKAGTSRIFSFHLPLAWPPSPGWDGLARRHGSTRGSKSLDQWRGDTDSERLATHVSLCSLSSTCQASSAASCSNTMLSRAMILPSMIQRPLDRNHKTPVTCVTSFLFPSAIFNIHETKPTSSMGKLPSLSRCCRIHSPLYVDKLRNGGAARPRRPFSRPHLHLKRLCSLGSGTTQSYAVELLHLARSARGCICFLLRRPWSGRRHFPRDGGSSR